MISIYLLVFQVVLKRMGAGFEMFAAVSEVVRERMNIV